MKMRSRTSLLLASMLALMACNSSNSNAPIVPMVDTTAPVIVAADQQVFADSMDNDLMVSVTDNASSPAMVTLAISSSNQDLVSEDGLTTALDGGMLVVRLTPQSDKVGSTMLSVMATDEAQNMAMQTFSVDVIANQVAASVFVTDLVAADADSEPLGINGIEFINDLEDDVLLDSIVQ